MARGVGGAQGGGRAGTSEAAAAAAACAAGPLILGPGEMLASSCCICSHHHFEKEGFSDHTVIICDQCEREYHVGCLRKQGRCDLKVRGGVGGGPWVARSAYVGGGGGGGVCHLATARL